MLSPKVVVLFSMLTLAALSAAPGQASDELRDLVLQLTVEIKRLKTEVAESNARINELEKKLQLAGKSSNLTTATGVEAPQATRNPIPVEGNKKSVYAGDVKATFKVPGTDTSIGFGGFAKLDTLYSSISMGKDKLGNQRLEVAEIPVDSSPAGEDDQISMHAKESRVWMKSFTPSQWGDLQTYLEMDFLGEAAAYNYTPRLRHAYGSLGNLLAGQTWSTFFNSRALADTLDNNNSSGALLALRQPQIRWTQDLMLDDLHVDWQLAAEAPRSRIWDSALQAMTTISASHYPDLVGRINVYPDWGNMSLSVLGRHLQYNQTPLNAEKSSWAGAISMAGKVNMVGADNIRFMLGYGDGYGRYATNNFFADAAIDATGEMDTVVSYSGMFAYQHWWDQTWRSTLAYGFARADQPSFASRANQQAQSLHANLLWSPILQTTIGLEYIYANRELVNGANGELQRVQFSTRFNF